MKQTVSAMLFMAFLTFAPVKQALSSSEPLLAEVSLFAGNFAPRGFMFCEGQLLSIAHNTALFSLLGTTYGGDGRTTFGLPNLKAVEKSLGGVRHIIAIQGIFPSRN